MKPQSSRYNPECGYVDVLTSEANGLTIGYRFIGARPGPQLAIAGFCKSSEQVFDRLISIPSLPWMRGKLVFLRLDALDSEATDLSRIPFLGSVDRTVTLPWTDSFELDDKAVREGYRMVLRACAAMGMISGRGIPPE